MSFPKSTPVVLLTEKDPIVAFGLEMDLGAEGFATAGPFANGSSTLAWLGTETPDSAILDPHPRDGTSREVAAVLIQRNVPFVIFSASCKHENTSPEFAHAQWIEKPRPGQEVVQLLVGQQRQMRVQAAAHSHSQLRLTNPPPLSSVSSQPISQRPLSRTSGSWLTLVASNCWLP